MKTIILGCVTSFTIVLSACASNPSRVMLRDNGQVEAIASSEKESDAVISAVDAAQRYCKGQNKEALFASDQKSECPERPEDRALGVLKKLPGIGKALEGDEKNNVSLRFRCV